MATLSNIELRNIQTQILRENSVKKAVKKHIQSTFEDVQKQFLKSFNEHPVTMEIEGGPTAGNISRTLNGVGNLFTYIGFSEGERPIDQLRKLLEKYEIQYHPHRNYITVSIIVPTKEEIFAATPVPWAAGRSWVRGIERGLSGLGQYLYKGRRIVKSKSGYAIQVRGKVRSGRFSNVKYISSLLNDYYKAIKKIEDKRFL